MSFHLQKQIPNGKMTNAYGMTEIGGVSTDTEGLPKTVGKIHPWIHWRVKLYIIFANFLFSLEFMHVNS